MDKVKVYTSQDGIPQDKWQKYLIHPVRAYWGDGTPKWHEYKHEFEFYKEIVELVDDITQADVCFLPMTWNYYTNHDQIEQARSLAENAEANNKVIMVWVDGDRGIRQPFPNAAVLQNAAQKSSLGNYQYIRPGDARDLVTQFFDGQTPIRDKKASKPKIGFCGQADSNRVALIAVRNIRSVLSYSLRITDYEPIVPIRPHILLRKEVLDKLENSQHVDSQFVVRTRSTTRTTRDNTDWRQQFIDNMRDTEYNVAVRGTSNYSIRFYETLAMGRIPLFINTDCVLPFEDEIDWKSYCVWVEEKDLDRAGEIVAEFHEKLSEPEFRDLQVACRQLWVDRMSPRGFHKHLREYIADAIAKYEKNTL